MVSVGFECRPSTSRAASESSDVAGSPPPAPRTRPLGRPAQVPRAADRASGRRAAPERRGRPSHDEEDGDALQLPNIDRYVALLTFVNDVQFYSKIHLLRKREVFRSLLFITW